MFAIAAAIASTATATSSMRCQRKSPACRSAFAEPSQVLEVLRPAGRALHSHQMLEAAHSHRNTVEGPLEGVGTELSVEIVGLHSAEPLHHIEPTEVGEQAEVPSHRRAELGTMSRSFV